MWNAGSQHGESKVLAKKNYGSPLKINPVGKGGKDRKRRRTWNVRRKDRNVKNTKKKSEKGGNGC